MVRGVLCVVCVLCMGGEVELNNSVCCSVCVVWCVLYHVCCLCVFVMFCVCVILCVCACVCMAVFYFTFKLCISMVVQTKNIYYIKNKHKT